MPDDIQPTPSPAGPSDKDQKLWNMLCHLSALCGYIVPLGNILGPLIVWQIKKNEIPSVVEHGKEAMNFQITATLAIVVLATVGSLLCVGPLIALVVAVAALVMAILAGIKANNGESYRYPLTWRLIK